MLLVRETFRDADPKRIGRAKCFWNRRDGEGGQKSLARKMYIPSPTILRVPASYAGANLAHFAALEGIPRWRSPRFDAS
jgi:hypothetical protein